MRNTTFIYTATAFFISLMSRIPDNFVKISLRLGLAGIFWVSARTKVTDLLTVSDNTYFLFEEEYNLPFISAEILAPIATYAEHILPLMLAIGFATRFAAAGLFVITLVIQIFVYPDAFLSTHLGWMAMSFSIMRYGPGHWSLDHLIASRTQTPVRAKVIY
ncbi:DoxX family protein [Sneathiella glossodoripedis]|uniref:DoxX family protein n=1 Tax=Sneathiella glossodoripedis TaxID=418853 RepID=UPI000472D046|nr:DoxX family protein [Sneathiella glossodoripedis]